MTSLIGRTFIENPSQFYGTTLGHRNHVVGEDRLKTAIAVAVHNIRIGVFCYAQRSSLTEETNRVQIAVSLFSLWFSLDLNFSYSYSTVLQNVFPIIFCLFLVLNP